MQATVRRPSSPDELQRLYALRAKVFYGEAVLNRNAVTSLSDPLDRSPHAINLIAVTPDDEIIGGARASFPHGNSRAADTPYFDFRPFLPDDGATASCGSMLWVDRRHRRSKLAMIMTRSVVALSSINGMTHLCVAAHPMLKQFLVDEGWTAAADEFMHPVENVPVVPFILDLADRTPDAGFVLAGQDEIGVEPSDVWLSGAIDLRPQPGQRNQQRPGVRHRR